MPELPEVETTRRGIVWLCGQKIKHIIVRHPRLRWPVPQEICEILPGQVIQTINRRGKYLLLETAKGTVILHLGMSGSLRILKKFQPAEKHDHIDIEFTNGILLRFTDPRRFGALLWTTEDPAQHLLLKDLGPEPLNRSFTGISLHQRAAKRHVPIKTFIMDSKNVVGVGNIYANEALFAAGIHPETPASQISPKQFAILVYEIKKVLRAAIKQGGTTLKDFFHGEAKPGYFKVHLKVYGRAGLPCVGCGTVLQEIRLGQRSTVFCVECQLR